jgi:glyoxylase-like metal-dependent hydrolase (beta-lactamase superfamily II)
MQRRSAMKEEDLGSLGIFRIPIPIPFRDAGGPVNAYVIEEDHGITLFDAGIEREESLEAFAKGLAKIGHRFEEVNRIILSHGHIDHYGAVVWALERIGRAVPIMIHPADADKVLESGANLLDLLRRNNRYLLKLGVPLHTVEEMVSAISREDNMSRRLSNATPLLSGAKFQCKHVTLEVLHMPGHTPGLCCLYDRDNRILFSADHLLERVSPNPLIDLSADGEPTSFKPLISYFESIDRVRAMPVDLVLPGHATPFTKHRDVIDSLSKFYEQRQAKVLAAFKHKSLTVYEAMQALFPAGNAFALFLMLSETLGNLELLEARGKIKRATDGECICFQHSEGRG